MPRKSNKNQADKSASETTDKQTGPQVNDVAKPGETPSTPTSRPVITGHGTMLKQDPMVSGKKSSEDPLDDKDANIITKKDELTLEPSSVPAEESAPENPAGEEPPSTEEEPADAKDKPEETPPEKTEAAEAKKDDQPKNPEEDSGSDSAAIDSLATSAESKKLDTKAAEEEQKRKEKIQGLIAEKKYFIPIVEGGHKASSQRFMSWLLLILLLSAAGVYLAVDAGYLDVGISLPFDLIKN